MIEKWFYIIPSVFFGFLVLLAINKNKKYRGNNYLPLFIILLYFTSSILIYFVQTSIWYSYYHEESYTAINFTIYSVYLFLFLLPALYLKPLGKGDYIPSTRYLSWVMVSVSVLGIFSIGYQLPYAIKSISSNVLDFRVRKSFADGYTVLPKGFLTTLSVGISYFYLFYIALLFIAIIQKKNYIIRIGLLIASLSYIVSGLVHVTRDVYVYYIIGFVFIYLYFQNKLSKIMIRKVKKKYSIIGLLMIIAVSYISQERFLDSNTLLRGTIGYLAQQPFVFSETVEWHDEFYGGYLRFPYFMKLLGSDDREIIRVMHYERGFGTFIKDIYAEGGFKLLSFITMLFVPLFVFRIKKCKNSGFYNNLIVVLFYFQFISMGLFYFKLGTRAGNIYMIILIVLYLLTRFSSVKKEKIYVQ